MTSRTATLHGPLSRTRNISAMMILRTPPTCTEDHCPRSAEPYLPMTPRSQLSIELLTAPIAHLELRQLKSFAPVPDHSCERATGTTNTHLSYSLDCFCLVVAQRDIGVREACLSVAQESVLDVPCSSACGDNSPTVPITVLEVAASAHLKAPPYRVQHLRMSSCGYHHSLRVFSAFEVD